MRDKELAVRIVEEKRLIVLRTATYQEHSILKYFKVERPTGLVKKKRPLKVF